MILVLIESSDPSGSNESVFNENFFQNRNLSLFEVDAHFGCVLTLTQKYLDLRRGGTAKGKIILTSDFHGMF